MQKWNANWLYYLTSDSTVHCVQLENDGRGIHVWKAVTFCASVHEYLYNGPYLFYRYAYSKFFANFVRVYR